jgi:transcriptional regulator with XRE-family HTH domain
MPKIGLTVDRAPGEVTEAIARLGRNIATARVRRRMSQRDLGRRAGISHITMGRVEAGHPTTAIGAYWAALWALGLEREFKELAAPDRDEEGKALELAREPRRVRHSGGLDADF